jgi:hypothetical protein
MAAIGDYGRARVDARLTNDSLGVNKVRVSAGWSAAGTGSRGIEPSSLW